MQVGDLLLGFKSLGWLLFDGFKRDRFLRVAANRAPQRLGVVGVDAGVDSSPGDAHIFLFAIDQARAAHRIVIDNDLVHGGCYVNFGSVSPWAC